MTESISLPDEALAQKKRNVRSTDVSVKFADGFAVGWVMAVPVWFREALDIELTERVQKHPVTGKKHNVMVWTEGKPPIYNFSGGDMLYDSRAAYEKKWGDALSEISLGLQVIDAVPDRLNGKDSKIPGWVRFAVYRPRKDRSLIEVVSKHRMSQDNFISTIKSGRMPDGVFLKHDV